MKQLYRSITNKAGMSTLPDYEMNEKGEVFRTQYHTEGWSATPDFVLKNEKQLFRAITNPLGASGLPEYEIRENQVFRTTAHPDGWGAHADFSIREA